MAITSSGSFVFAWLNHNLIEHLKVDPALTDLDHSRGPAYALIYTGLAVFGAQLVGALLLSIRPNPNAANSSSSAPSRLMNTAQIFKSWQFWCLLMIWFANLTPMLGILSVLADLLHDTDRFDQPSGTSANLLALVNATGVGFRLVVGILVARVGVHRFFTVALASQVVTFAIMPIVAINERDVWLFILLLCLSKMCYGDPPFIIAYK